MEGGMLAFVILAIFTLAKATVFDLKRVVPGKPSISPDVTLQGMISSERTHEVQKEKLPSLRTDLIPLYAKAVEPLALQSLTDSNGEMTLQNQFGTVLTTCSPGDLCFNYFTNEFACMAAGSVCCGNGYYVPAGYSCTNVSPYSTTTLFSICNANNPNINANCFDFTDAANPYTAGTQGCMSAKSTCCGNGNTCNMSPGSCQNSDTTCCPLDHVLFTAPASTTGATCYPQGSTVCNDGTLCAAIGDSCNPDLEGGFFCCPAGTIYCVIELSDSCYSGTSCPFAPTVAPTVMQSHAPSKAPVLVQPVAAPVAVQPTTATAATTLDTTMLIIIIVPTAGGLLLVICGLFCCWYLGEKGVINIKNDRKAIPYRPESDMYQHYIGHGQVKNPMVNNMGTPVNKSNGINVKSRNEDRKRSSPKQIQLEDDGASWDLSSHI